MILKIIQYIIKMGVICYEKRKKGKNKINKNIEERKEIVREVFIPGSNPTIPEEIFDILRTCIVRIEFNDNNNKRIFTGFFMKINLNKKKYCFLLTCEHSLSQENIDSEITIEIYYGNNKQEEKKEIKLDKNQRIIKCYKEFDVSLIEILEKDNIPKEKYLSPDLNYKNDGFSFYKNSQIYAGGYPDVIIYKRERHMSSGIINKINTYDFEHTCDTRNGSSGSPIININKQVIGIHYAGSKKKNINYAYFIGAIIDKFEKEVIIEKHKNNNNYINELNNTKENPKNNNNPKNIEDKNMKKLIINSIPLVQDCMDKDPNFIKNCLMMYKDPNTRASLEKMPYFKNIFDHDFFKKIEDPNFVDNIPSNEEFNSFFNKIKDENEEKEKNN